MEKGPGNHFGGSVGGVMEGVDRNNGEEMKRKKRGSFLPL